MRRKLKILGASFLVLGILGTVGYFLFDFLRPKGAAILVDSTPSSIVFIDDEQVGKTPHEGVLSPGEVTVKLVPESYDIPLIPYETKVTLVAGIKTVIRRTFGEKEETSSGEIISFEKTGADVASLAIISIPDQTEIFLDGQPKGFTPIKISSISGGRHQLKLRVSGYKEMEFTIEPAIGYRLTSAVFLAKDLTGTETLEQPEQKTEESLEEKVAEVEILSTPTGFLRVRREPSSLSEEVAQVKPGEKYKLLDTDKKSGWFKIEYKEDKTGWISNQYAKNLGDLTPTPTQSPKATSLPQS